jgi:hypothetical protein
MALTAYCQSWPESYVSDTSFLPFTVKIAQDINTIAVQNLASDWSAKATGGKNLAPL